MIVSAIAACSKDRVIGVGNKLPWHLPSDMKYFMRTTRHHHVIMGRRTFQSLGNPLKNRTNIVITRNPFFVADGVFVTHSIEEALKLAENNGEEEVFIIGGAEIYIQSLPLLDKIYLTEIDLNVPDGDAFFPDLNDDWIANLEESHQPDENNKFSYTFKIYHKKKAPPSSISHEPIP